MHTKASELRSKTVMDYIIKKQKMEEVEELKAITKTLCKFKVRDNSRASNDNS